jgi:hypothetical protein
VVVGVSRCSVAACWRCSLQVTCPAAACRGRSRSTELLFVAYGLRPWLSCKDVTKSGRGVYVIIRASPLNWCDIKEVTGNAIIGNGPAGV